MRTAETADDRTLVTAAQAGDRRAIETLLRRHYDRVYAICRRVVGSSRDADDAAQEAMISIVRGLPRFDGRAAFSTWTYRIATNAALDELRKRQRRPSPHAAGDDGTTAEVVDVDSHRNIDAVDDRMAIDAAIDELPQEFRVAVVLRDVCDLDYAEIASTLDIPVGTVKSRIARGRSLLASRLGNPADPADRPTNTAAPHEATDDG
jgi:RNA polymerase sigma-70 factor, ECF subfamily